MLKRSAGDGVMAFWPFGRKKRKTMKPDEQTMDATTKGKVTDSTRTDPGHNTADVNASYFGRKPSRKGSRGKRRTPAKLSKSRSRTRDPEKVTSIPAVPALPQHAADYRDPFNEKVDILADPGQSNNRLTKNPSNREDIPSYYFQNPLSSSSLQPERFSVVPNPPTLAKSNTNTSTLPRRKSSKRKADDYAREQEVKAMSTPIHTPKRPASHTPGLLTRDTKRGSLRLRSKEDRPTSDASLPYLESMHSTKSEISDGHSFMVSALDALSPRPTIKYSENPRYGRNTNSLGPSRVSARKEKQQSIPEATFNSKERIDDLADELDAGSLRELMERDRRRREKKRRSDHEKLQRRLQRRSERQRQEEKQAERTSDERDSEIFGLGIGEGSTAQRQDNAFDERGRKDTKSPDSWLRDPSKENVLSEDPFKDPMAESHFEEASPMSEKDEPIIETAKAVRMSQANMSPPTSPKQYVRGPSKLSLLSDLASKSTSYIPERQEPNGSRRESDTNANLAGSWTSFFKRGGTRAKRHSDQGRASSSEFSNLSRDSLARQYPPPTFSRNSQSRSGTPVRTQSKFREDLPELPISPPISRVQSPGNLSQSNLAPEAPNLKTAARDIAQPLSEIHPAFREEVALSRHQSLHAPSPDGPSSAVLSQSLASVDSEGSWLSGRPPKRSSLQANLLRGSAGSLQRRLQDLGSSTEELGVAEDEYFARISPGPETSISREPSYSKRKISTVSEGSDDIMLRPQLAVHTEEEATLRDAVGRQPTIIRRSPRAKSREGLLDDFLAGDESPASSPSGDSPAADHPRDPVPEVERASVHHATSVDLAGKGHARHMSAGSARLLDVPARLSGEFKRLSSGSVEKSPLGTQPQDEGIESNP